MSGLNTSLMIAMQSLLAEQGALDVTTNNIANVNTPGYTREVPVLSEAPATQEANYSIGNGVVLEKFQSIRNQVLEQQINQVTQQNASVQAQTNSLQQIEPLFTAGSDIGSEMSALFTSITQLQTDPANGTLRQGILTAGQNLAGAFHSTAAGIAQAQAGLNTQVAGDVGQINQLAQEIAPLNLQLANLQATGQDGGPVEDRLNMLIGKLSALTDLNVTQSESGLTLTTGNGTALVVGGQSFALQTATGSDGMAHVLDSTGKDITSSIQNGDLGGSLEVRDTILPGILKQLNTLASQFATAFNTAHESGFDQNGIAGVAFFNAPSTGSGSAANFTVAITDPTLIAASSDGSAGSNGNLANLIAVQNAPLPSGSSPIDSYATIVFAAGSASANAQAQTSATAMSLLQLSNQRSAMSGVSINEESTNLIRYQQAFQAAAKVISTIDQLGTIAINMISS